MKLPSNIEYAAFALEDSARNGLDSFRAQFASILELFRSQYKLTTVSVYTSRLRSELDRRLPQNTPNRGLMLAAICLPESDYDTINSRYERKLQTNASRSHSNRTKLDGTAIKVAHSMIQSDSLIDRTIGLRILTGRRTVELIKTATFEKTMHPHVVVFGGQVKKKWLNSEPYKIPILCDWNTLKQAIKRQASAMEKRANMTVGEASKSINLSNMVKEYFGDHITPHTLRHWYAAYCVHLYKPDSVLDTLFVGKILGHEADEMIDEHTSASYQTCYVPHDTTLPTRPDKNVWKLLTT